MFPCVFFDDFPTLITSLRTSIVSVTYKKWVTIEGTCLDVEDIWHNETIPESISVKLYDNTTGVPEEIIENVFILDTNNNGKYDLVMWKIPSTSTRYYYIEAAKGEPLQVNYTTEQITKPVVPFQTIKFRRNYTIYNPNDFSVDYTIKMYLPVEATSPILDGSELMTIYWDESGAYVSKSFTVGANETQTHYIDYFLPAIAKDEEIKFPPRFWVGELSPIKIIITVTNYATETIENISIGIPISYGENVTLYKNGEKIKEVDSVRGYFSFEIENLTGYESKSYVIMYRAPTAEAIAGKYSGRRIINGTQYLMYPIYVKSVASFPLTNLSMRLEVSDPFKCYDLKFCWLTDKDTYLNPPKGEELDLDCEDSKTAILDIGELSVGGEKYITCFLKEKERPAPVLPDIYNFFDWLISVIKNFINWLMGLFK